MNYILWTLELNKDEFDKIWKKKVVSYMPAKAEFTGSRTQ